MENNNIHFIASFNGELVDRVFTDRADFINHYHSSLLELRDDNGVIDLSDSPFVSNVINTIDDERLGGTLYLSGDGQRLFSFNEVIWSEVMDRHILRRYSVQINGDGYASQRWANINCYVEVRGSEGYWDSDNPDIVYVAEGFYAYYDDATYDETSGEWFYNEANIEECHDAQTTFGSWSRWNNYPILVPDSKCQVGYEIEKSRFTINGEHVRREGDTVAQEDGRPFRAFSRFIPDSSCGVEAITKVLPGDPQYLNDVFDMFDEAADVINSPYQATGDRQCGGHISISYDGLDKLQLANGFRVAMPILMSIWRKRLKHGYANGNSICDYSSNAGFRGRPMVNLGRSNNSVELRLPPAVEDVRDQKFRHKLITSMIDITITQGVQDFTQVYNALRPIIVDHYGDDSGSRLAYVNRFKQILDMDPGDVRGNLPNGCEPYFRDFLSEQQRAEQRRRDEAERQARRAEEIRLQRLADEAILVALRSTRRRPKTVAVGDTFTVSGVIIEGVRRSRVIRVTPGGLVVSRGYRQLHIPPSEVHGLTITTTNGDLIEWSERIRAGEVIHYIPNVIFCEDREPMPHFANNSWANPQMTGNLLATRSWQDNQYLGMFPGDELFINRSSWNGSGRSSSLRIWDRVGDRWTPPTQDQINWFNNHHSTQLV